MKLLNIEKSPESFLALAMGKPNLDKIDDAVLRLKEMLALESNGDISFIGRMMASLPIDPKLSKLIAYGYCFSVECVVIGKEQSRDGIVLQMILTIEFGFLAAALSCTQNFFKYNANDAANAYNQRLKLAEGMGSDLFVIYNAYNEWIKIRETQPFLATTTRQQKYECMNRNGLNTTLLI